MKQPELLSKESIKDQGLLITEDKWNVLGGFIWMGPALEQMGKLENNGPAPYTGIVYEVFENGNLMYYKILEDGMVVSEAQYYSSGGLHEYAELWMRNQSKTGFFYSYFEDGKLHEYRESQFGFLTKQYIYNEQGQLVKSQEEPRERIKESIKKMKEKFESLEQNNRRH